MRYFIECLFKVSVYNVKTSRRGLATSGLALTGAVYYASQRPAKSILLRLTLARQIDLTLLDQVPATVTVYRGHRRTLFFLPGINSLFIMCVGIIRNNSLVGGRARAESNPGHCVHHTLL